jgi:hypothetical protein
MRAYYERNQHIISHGKCVHGKWDVLTVFFCHESIFDEVFSEFKSRTNLMTQEMEIIKIIPTKYSESAGIPVTTLLPSADEPTHIH